LTLQAQNINFKDIKFVLIEGVRMQKSKLYIAVFTLLTIIAFIGSGCGNADMETGKLYFKEKQYDKALEAFQRVVTKDPKSAEGFYRLGMTYGEKEDYSKMNEAFHKSLAIGNEFKSDIDNLKKYYWANMFNRGVGLYQRGVNSTDKDSSKIFFDKSMKMFEYAAQTEPDSADAYKNLAFVYMGAGENEKAIEPLQKLIELEHSLDGYKYLGEIYYNMGVTDRNKFATSNDANDSLKANEDFNNSIKVLEDGRTHFPDDGDLMSTLANACVSAGKIDLALNIFKTGTEKDPENQFYHYNYGVLLLGENKYEAAAEQFKKAVDINPEYQNAVYNLAVTYVKWGTAINKEAEDKGEMDNTEYKVKYQNALPYLEKSVELESKDAAVWELLGKVYTVLDMTSDAENAYKKADDLRK
jgi:tetratricopeptide (TPR) repeat protein